MDPGQAPTGGYGELALTSLVVLLLVCAVVLVAARCARRWLRGSADGETLVTVRARVPLEPRRSLVLVEVGGRTLLVGSSEGGVTLVSEIAAGELPARVEAVRSGFAELVARAMARRRPAAAESRSVQGLARAAVAAPTLTGERDEKAASAPELREVA